ncbi:hypothetical protein [Novosphingobium sp.]|uniref:hypothetical protein n=1 Tax=Novosphingobium sp. TaxID=1874826 RepID=UPI0031DDAFB6
MIGGYLAKAVQGVPTPALLLLGTAALFLILSQFFNPRVQMVAGVFMLFAVATIVSF